MKEIILAYMVLSGVKPAQMARCFGVSERTWRKWLADPENQLTAYRLNVIANVLHMTDEDFLKMARRAA